MSRESENIFDNQFVTVTYNKISDFLTLRYKPETISMDDDDFKYIIINQWLKVSAKFSLIDARERYYALSPEIQNWLNNEIFPESFKMGGRKIGMIVSNDLIPAISIEQLADLSKEKCTVEVRYFSNEVDALNWLGCQNFDTL